MPDMLTDYTDPLGVIHELDAEDSATHTATEALADALRAANVPAAPESITTEQTEETDRLIAAITKGAIRG